MDRKLAVGGVGLLGTIEENASAGERVTRNGLKTANKNNKKRFKKWTRNERNKKRTGIEEETGQEIDSKQSYLQ